jgi:hypothetical protein
MKHFNVCTKAWKLTEGQLGTYTHTHILTLLLYERERWLWINTPITIPVNSGGRTPLIFASLKRYSHQINIFVTDARRVLKPLVLCMHKKVRINAMQNVVILIKLTCKGSLRRYLSVWGPEPHTPPSPFRHWIRVRSTVYLFTQWKGEGRRVEPERR